MGGKGSGRRGAQVAAVYAAIARGCQTAGDVEAELGFTRSLRHVTALLFYLRKVGRVRPAGWVTLLSSRGQSYQTTRWELAGVTDDHQTRGKLGASGGGLGGPARALAGSAAAGESGRRGPARRAVGDGPSAD